MTRAAKKTSYRGHIIGIIVILLIIGLHLGTKGNTKSNYANAGNFLSSKGQTKEFNPIPAKLRWE
jgi:hypothetical protein